MAALSNPLSRGTTRLLILLSSAGSVKYNSWDIAELGEGWLTRSGVGHDVIRGRSYLHPIWIKTEALQIAEKDFAIAIFCQGISYIEGRRENPHPFPCPGCKQVPFLRYKICENCHPLPYILGGLAYVPIHVYPSKQWCNWWPSLRCNVSELPPCYFPLPLGSLFKRYKLQINICCVHLHYL